jgi:hypothetical protein
MSNAPTPWTTRWLFTSAVLSGEPALIRTAERAADSYAQRGGPQLRWFAPNIVREIERFHGPHRAPSNSYPVDCGSRFD